MLKPRFSSPALFPGFAAGKIDVGEGEIFYQLGGEGETVVLLHGWPQHSLQWHAVAPRLAAGYRVLVPDLPGCGASSFIKGGYDKATIATLVRSMVDKLELGPVRLVGYDHGAGVAYNYACQDQAGVRQLALLEYVLPGHGYEKAMLPSSGWHTGSNWQLAFFTVPDVAEFAFQGKERELLSWFFWHGAANPHAIGPDHLQLYVDQLKKPGALRAGIEYYAAVWKDLEANRLNAQQKLSMPVLGVGGRANAGGFVAKALGDVAESVTAAVIDGAGHWLSDENPEELSRVLLEFFHAA